MILTRKKKTKRYWFIKWWTMTLPTTSKSRYLLVMYIVRLKHDKLELGCRWTIDKYILQPVYANRRIIKMGDKFRTKGNCVKATKKYHMKISFDYRFDRTNVTRYKILCRNVPCMFQLITSYRNRSDSCEIGSMGSTYTCIITNPMQDHQKSALS